MVVLLFVWVGDQDPARCVAIVFRRDDRHGRPIVLARLLAGRTVALYTAPACIDGSEFGDRAEPTPAVRLAGVAVPDCDREPRVSGVCGAETEVAADRNFRVRLVRCQQLMDLSTQPGVFHRDDSVAEPQPRKSSIRLIRNRVFIGKGLQKCDDLVNQFLIGVVAIGSSFDFIAAVVVFTCRWQVVASFRKNV